MAHERRTPPVEPALHEAGRRRPGTWIYDIDWPYPDDQRSPPEAIRGGWEAGPDGRLTGLFARNPHYRAIERCTRALKPYVHAATRTSRDQWMTEIDPRGEDRFPDIPEDLIRGWWYVGPDGIVTDRFRPNARWIDDAATGNGDDDDRR